MKEVPLTRGLVAFVDDEDFALVSQYKWHATPDPDRITYRAAGAVGRRPVLMHRLIMDAPVGMQVDHRNHNPLDNQRRNLRIATCAQNQWNSRIRRDNRTGFKGVTKITRRILGRPYAAQIRDGGKVRYLGCFATPEEAARAYDAAAVRLYGEFAYINFPIEQAG